MNKDNLNQPKDFMKKINITDVAISKVPYIEYKGFSEKQNIIMRRLTQEVLILSKEENHNNEVAITFDIFSDNPLENYGISYGDEHSVTIAADTLSNHLLVSQDSIAVVILHNHPSIQTFSLTDISFFLQYDNVKMMSVVSNYGKVHYLYKDKKFDLNEAIILWKKCTAELDSKSTVKELYYAALSFLAICSESGIYYN
ncbi:MAG: hypothetical protein NC417_06835 [Candidatus Gastranaerophilales bacterium]|nr:hypothetical protein [Candidatus Gastranaerophilales bacterium]